MRSSYALRLAAAFAAVGAAAAGLTALAVNLAVSGLLNGYFDQQQAQRRDQVVAALAASYQARGAWDPADLSAIGSGMTMGGGTLTVLDGAGATVWRSPAAAPAAAGMMGMHAAMAAGALGPERRLPVVVGGDRVGTAVLRLPLPGLAAPDQRFREAVNRALLVTGLLAALLAVGAGLLLARRATVPVRRLTAAAEAWRRGQHDRRVGYAAADEFGAMARSFDRMADSIEEQERVRRAFTSEVAHELRTPLMILGGQVEAMQDGVLARDDAALASLHEETARLGRLVADLEVLASADAARFGLQLAPVDLGRLASEVAAEFRGLFPDRRLALQVEGGLGAVEGDAGRLRQVLGNLLSNALRLTPAGGLVTARVAPSGRDALLEVADSGPGIPEEELPRVFDRFFRGSRAAGAGSGIGLAVVRELVTAHGGSVRAASRPGGGALFQVRLPAAAGAAGGPRERDGSGRA